MQLGGFVEKYAGSGVTLHTSSSSSKENRRTEGLNRYLQTLQSNQSAAPGQRSHLYSTFCGVIVAACTSAFKHLSCPRMCILSSLAFIKLNSRNNTCFFSASSALLALPRLCAVSSDEQQGSAEAGAVLSASPMMQVEGFFTALTNSNTDGRVSIHRQGTTVF